MRGVPTQHAQELVARGLVLLLRWRRATNAGERVLVDDDRGHRHRVTLREHLPQVGAASIVGGQRLHLSKQAHTLDALGSRRPHEMHKALVGDTHRADHRQAVGLTHPLVDGHDAPSLVHPLTHARLVARFEVDVRGALIGVGHHLREGEAVQRAGEQLPHAGFPRRQSHNAPIPLDDRGRVATEAQRAPHDLCRSLRGGRVGRG